MKLSILLTASSFAFAIAVQCVAAAADAPVTVAPTDKAFVLANDHVAITVDKTTGEVTSLKYRVGDELIEIGDKGPRAFYWDINAAPARPAPGQAQKPGTNYLRLFQCLTSIQVASASPDMADLAIGAGPSQSFPFHAQFHYVLRRGQSGFYAYALFSHDKGMPAATLEQTRCVIRAENHGVLFTDQIVDAARKGPPPASKTVSTLQDATFRLADGSAYTKYDNAAFVKDFSSFGMAGHGVGLWLVWPSTESCNGGPFKQELTVQIDNIMQAMFQGQHFGAAAIKVADDERWTKCFGPVLVYLNHGGATDALWKNAREEAARQHAAWPMSWINDINYPLQRGSVNGRLALHDSHGARVGGAWAILASSAPSEEATDWAMRSKGYEFWTRVGDDGTFHIAQVRPGNYTLFVSGADQFEDFQKADVTVRGDQDTALGTLDWTPPTHGKRLWQIGTADRSSAEFHNGAEPAYRNFDTFLGYFKTFPHDVTFTIGQSHEATDWEYAQWNWYSDKPAWTIAFQLDPADVKPGGKALLTMGIASARPAGKLLAQVNARDAGSISLPPTSGEAGYRSGGQDSLYTVRTLSFDASLLKPGLNEITLAQSQMFKFTPELLQQEKRPMHHVIFDAIRLEIEPPAR